MAKGEEAPPLEQAQVLLVRTSGQAIKTMEQQTDLMRGETSLIEQQGRKTMVEAIDQAQKLVDQAHQVSTCGIRTGANMAQDWLALTWHMWDTAADAMRSVMLSGTAAAAHRGEA
ncbi:MAG TPA: hypothetical protein VHP11_15695 [Tepidisphaeraceae bacterium]|nr:hypothetical protein [Tepidisphaeraceae bacterium]